MGSTATSGALHTFKADTFAVILGTYLAKGFALPSFMTPQDPNDPTLEERLHPASGFVQRVQTLVLSVGDFIRQESQTFTRAQAEIKGRNDLVSYVDREAEQRLHNGFKEILPGSGFIMEETGEHNEDADFIWVIDPLDGTTNFVYGIPAFCISVGLMYRGKVVLGAVYEINRDELFFASRGQGAFLNGEPIGVSASQDLGKALIATGFPFRKFQNVDEYLAMLVTFMRRTKGLRRIGSAALDLAYVAAGRFDGFFEAHLFPWDVAGGSLLVQEAGGIVTDYFNEANYLFGGMIVAASPGIHPLMIETVQQHLHTSS